MELDIGSVERHVASLNQVLADLRRRQRAWQAGAEGEASVIRVLVGMDDASWHVLPDRRWPGTRRANIDVLVVGTGGVFVIDVKAWREVRVESGRLWRGDAPTDDAVQKLLDQTTAVEEVLAEEGLPPTEVVPMLVLAGRRNARARLDRVLVMGEHDLVQDLLRRGVRLTPQNVERVVSTLERECPPMPAPPPAPVPSGPALATNLRPAPAGRQSAAGPHLASEHTGDQATGAEQGGGELLSRDQVWEALVEAAAREPLESWMTWLHPAQARMVSRTASGPARIRGAAGTGKTVLALHRAKYLAARGDRVLFTSFVKTLAPVNKALFARIAPDHTDRVVFASVHSMALRYLRRIGYFNPDGLGLRFAPDETETCWAQTWRDIGRRNAVLDPLQHGYWRDEVMAFIKGKGITDFEDYAARPRVGRRMRLQPAQRREVWRLYEHYQTLLSERSLLDSHDLLREARDCARSDTADEALTAEHGTPGIPSPRPLGGPESAFDAVIVDEAQDLPIVGLQFLHALVGDKPDGLLIVGDGQQAIYAGGSTLAEAGIAVTGRSTVLRHNYRNRELILRHALDVVSSDQYADLDAELQHGMRDVTTIRSGGEVVRVTGTPQSQALALATHIRDVIDDGRAQPGEIAVLLPNRYQLNRWLEQLHDARVHPRIRLDPLSGYDGHASELPLIGTYHRAKGLEFAYVYLPDHDQHATARRAHETLDAYRDRADLQRRQLFVAMTRARDGLWLGARTHP